MLQIMLLKITKKEKIKIFGRQKALETKYHILERLMNEMKLFM